MALPERKYQLSWPQPQLNQRAVACRPKPIKNRVHSIKQVYRIRLIILFATLKMLAASSAQLRFVTLTTLRLDVVVDFFTEEVQFDAADSDEGLVAGCDPECAVARFDQLNCHPHAGTE